MDEFRSKFVQIRFGNAVVPLTGSRNGAQGEDFDGVIKSNPLKLLVLLKENLLKSMLSL
jgi:hypothetical protein